MLYSEKYNERKNPFYRFINRKSSMGFDIPDVSMFGMLKISANSHPDAIAYEYYGKKCSYKNLITDIERTSDAFYRLGVRKGDIVTILMPNTPEAVLSIYALNRIGAVSNIVHPLSAQEEIKNYINSCKCKFLVAVNMCVEKVDAIIDQTTLQRVVVVSPAESMSAHMRIGYNLMNKTEFPKEDSRYISWKKLVRHLRMKAEEFNPQGRENEEASIILHSGGTTGTPKDIMLSNKNFNAFAMQSVLTLYDVSVGDKILAILPVFHGFGLGVCIHDAFCFGACSVLVPRFNPQRFGSLMKKYKPTLLFGVPTLYEAMLNSKGVENLDLSFLKYVVSGGDSLPRPLEIKVNAFLERHNANTRICEGYGMTEGLAALTLSVYEGYKSGTVGKPLMGNEMCITRPGTVNVLSYGEEGELCVCGPTVMIGYRNNELETSAVLKKHSDGKLWLHTGDMAVIDSEGFVHYKLRLKRLIISSGYNIYPTQIEKVIESLPEVSKCAVVAIPHTYKKEVAKAYIVLERNVTKSTFLMDKIKGFCKKNLSHYSVPYEFEFVKELPKTPFGKIDYVKLQKKRIIL